MPHVGASYEGDTDRESVCDSVVERAVERVPELTGDKITVCVKESSAYRVCSTARFVVPGITNVCNVESAEPVCLYGTEAT